MPNAASSPIVASTASAMFAAGPPGTRPGARTARAHAGMPSSPTSEGEMPATSVVTPWYAFQVTMTPVAAGRRLRDAQREVVRLRAGAGEHDVPEPGRRERREQLLGVVDRRLRQVPRVRVQPRRLLGDGRDDPRMRVPDRRDVVVRVEVVGAVAVEQVRALAAHELERLAVEEPVGGAEGGGAAAHEVGGALVELVDARGVEVAGGTGHARPPRQDVAELAIVARVEPVRVAGPGVQRLVDDGAHDRARGDQHRQHGALLVGAAARRSRTPP